MLPYPRVESSLITFTVADVSCYKVLVTSIVFAGPHVRQVESRRSLNRLNVISGGRAVFIITVIY